MKKYTILLIPMLITFSCNIDIKDNANKANVIYSEKGDREITDTFNLFIDLFEEKALPINFDQDYLMNYFPQRNSIDTQFVKAFISENIILNTNSKLFNLSTFYPVLKFEYDKQIVGIIYLQAGGAGGRDEHYFLKIFNKRGNTLYSGLFAEFMADCSFQKFLLGKLSQKLILNFKEINYLVNCDTEEKDLVSETDSTIIIHLKY